MASAISVIGFNDGVGVHRAPSVERGIAGLEQIVEVHALRRAGDPNAPPFALPAPGAILRRRFAGFVAIGEHDHVANVARQIERAKARGRKRRPGRRFRSPAWRQGRSRSLRRPSARRRARRGALRRRDKARASSSPDRPAPCRRRRGQERCGEWRSAIRSAPCVTSATIAGQTPPEGCFRPAWKRRARRSRKVEPARAQIGCDGRSLGRLRCLPDRQRRLAALQGVGVGFIGNRGRRCLRAMRPKTCPVVSHRPRSRRAAITSR